MYPRKVDKYSLYYESLLGIAEISMTKMHYSTNIHPETCRRLLRGHNFPRPDHLKILSDYSGVQEAIIRNELNVLLGKKPNARTT
jgi:hypothetical protein